MDQPLIKTCAEGREKVTKIDNFINDLHEWPKGKLPPSRFD